MTGSSPDPETHLPATFRPSTADLIASEITSRILQDPDDLHNPDE